MTGAPEAAADTIFALATGAGRAAIAIVRICGPRSGAVLEALAGSAGAPRMARLATLRDGSGAAIDQALTLWFPGPASETGEDMAELHLHGGPAVIEATLAVLAALGLRQAEPGEFARRAFANGKLDLTEAEGLADLVDAESEAQRLQALAQMSGGLKRLYEDWRERLIDIAALVDVGVAARMKSNSSSEAGNGACAGGAQSTCNASAARIACSSRSQTTAT